jgi:flagellar protein FliL
MAETDITEVEAEAPPAPQLFPALLPWLMIMGGISVLAIVIGGVAGLSMSSVARRNAQAAILAAQPAYSNLSLVDLPPVITNLADPTTAWVRLQAAVVVDKQVTTKPDVLGAEIADDMLGFMKTLSLSQIGGASGLQHLREDLSERAFIRSQGHVRELIIQTLVVQ